MNTEITDIKEFEGWVLYDGDCRFCTGQARRFQKLLAARHFAILPLQTPWVRARLNLPDPELLAEMRLLKRDGRIFGGADALLEISRHYRRAWPLYQLAKIPGVNKWLHRGYGWLARHRYCLNGACRISAPAAKKPGRKLFDFLPLVVLPLLALGFRTRLTPWIFMWAMAGALYAGCKWLTYREAMRRGLAPGRVRTLGYLLAWTGMDADEFLNRKNIPAKPRRLEWILALVKMGIGFILLVVATPRMIPLHPLLGGWAGMTGIILLLHFGLFHLLSLFWRQSGVQAVPLMQNPLRAVSLAEFWGKRWNTAFNEIAFRFSYRPLRRLTTPAIATLLVFGLSGLIHELVISLPARAGYGLPTAYFLIQGLGVLVERTRLGQNIGLGHGARGWCFTLFITAGPACWLFHPPFIQHVILPMLTAIGAT